MTSRMRINASAPQWLKDAWPEAEVVPDGEVFTVKQQPKAGPVKATSKETAAPVHWESGGIDPHAKPDGGVYGRD